MINRPVPRLLACVTTIAIVWLIVLPWVASRKSVGARIDWLDRQGIDPSAMYYTELDAMKPILEKLERR